MKKSCLSWILACTSASAWKIDLRNNYEDDHKIYMKAGETIEVILDGQAGTGYSWVSNAEWAKNKAEDDDEKDHVLEK